MRAYIFDLDGTLLDSMGLWKQIDVDFLAKRGFEVPSDYADAISSRSFPEAAEYTIKRFSLPDTPGDLLNEWNEMVAFSYGNTVPMKPNAKQYLLSLKAHGVKLAIATSLPMSLCKPALKNNGIMELFDAICSADEAPHGKTRPDIFLLAARKLGVSPAQCIVFEDIPQAIKSAKEAGMTVFGVFDKSSEENWALIKEMADSVIYDFKDAPMPE